MFLYFLSRSDGQRSKNGRRAIRIRLLLRSGPAAVIQTAHPLFEAHHMLAVYVHILDFFGLLSVVSQHDGLCSRRGYVELKGDGILPNLHGPYRRVLKIALDRKSVV